MFPNCILQCNVPQFLLYICALEMFSDEYDDDDDDEVNV